MHIVVVQVLLALLAVASAGLGWTTADAVVRRRSDAGSPRD